ncbi:MAG: carboxymuconolactone decarboxylase family protein [Myxococcales bacterium]|nr:carboxymuconolactone decarboxylase family protein [Myxococcales bacterium]
MRLETGPDAWRLFASWVDGDDSRARSILRAGTGLEPLALREAALMVHLFAGFPRMLEAFATIEAQRPEWLVADVSELRPETSPPFAAGEETFGLVYGSTALAVRARLEKLHPEAAAWVLGHAYGRVLSRPGLSLLDRELLAVASLVVLRAESQLKSHVRGAIRCGASPDLVGRVVESLVHHVDSERLAWARQLVASQ